MISGAQSIILNTAFCATIADCTDFEGRYVCRITVWGEYMTYKNWKIRGLFAAVLIGIISIVVPPQVCPDLFELPFTDAQLVRDAQQLGFEVEVQNGGAVALASAHGSGFGKNSKEKQGSQCLRAAPDICLAGPVASRKDIPYMLFHITLKPELFSNAGMKELPDPFKKRTASIAWDKGFVRTEEFYIDSYDGYLHKRGLTLRMRVDYSLLADQSFRTRSWITLKSRSPKIEEVLLFTDKTGVLQQTFIDKEQYSTQLDVAFIPLQISSLAVTPEEILNYIDESDPAMQKRLGGLRSVGEENIGRTDNFQMTTYTGSIATGPFKDQDVTMQVWGESGENPIVAEIRIEGEIENRKRLAAAFQWLTAALEKEQLVNDSSVMIKEYLIFKDAAAFTPPLMDLRGLP